MMVNFVNLTSHEVPKLNTILCLWIVSLDDLNTLGQRLCIFKSLIAQLSFIKGITIFTSIRRVSEMPALLINHCPSDLYVIFRF